MPAPPRARILLEQSQPQHTFYLASVTAPLPAPASNLIVARLFEEIAQSLEVAGEQTHRLRAYRRAARGVAAPPEPLEELACQGRPREISGIGPALEALIAEYLASGEIGTHARLVGAHPPGL